MTAYSPAGIWLVTGATLAGMVIALGAMLVR
jgi:hypothetical protein